MRLMAVLVTALLADLLWPLPAVVADVDSALYRTLARNLADGRGFVAPDRVSLSVPESGPPRPDVPSAIRTPGYPLFLAFLPDAAATAVQRTLRIAVAGSLYLIVLASTRRKRLALLCGLIYAVHLPSIAIAREVMTETLFAAVVFAVFVLLARNRPYAAAVIAGLAPLVRPIAVFFPIAVALWLFWQRRRMAAVAFVLVGLLPAGLWVVRNDRLAGAPILDCVTGENALFFRGDAVLVAAKQGPLFGLFALQRQFGFYHDLVRSRPALLAAALDEMRRQGIDPQQTTHARRSIWYARIGSRIMREHPVVFAELMVSGFIRLYFDAPWETAAAAGMDYRNARLLFLPLAVAAFFLAIFGWPHLRAIAPGLATLALLFIAYFTLLSSGPDAEPRFTTPFAPMLALLVAAGIDRIVERAAAWRARGQVRSDQKSMRRGADGDQSGRGADISS
jgi:hypothetical protein